MGSTPETTNSTASKVSTIISTTGNVIVNVVEGMIIADQPWLGTPGIKQIWEALFNYIASYFIKAAQQGATFAIIDSQVSKEKMAISEAMAALIVAEQSGDLNAIKNAIQNYANANSALLHDDGSNPN